jgi:hypothetical protein
MVTTLDGCTKRGEETGNSDRGIRIDFGATTRAGPRRDPTWQQAEKRLAEHFEFVQQWWPRCSLVGLVREGPRGFFSGYT